MTSSEGDRAMTINCFIEKKWRGRAICRQFRSKNWAQATVDRIIRQYEETGSYQIKSATGRPLSATTEAIENEILELTESQESAPGTSKSLWSASKKVNIVVYSNYCCVWKIEFYLENRFLFCLFPLLIIV